MLSVSPLRCHSVLYAAAVNQLYQLSFLEVIEISHCRGEEDTERAQGSNQCPGYPLRSLCVLCVSAVRGPGKLSAPVITDNNNFKMYGPQFIATLATRYYAHRVYEWNGSHQNEICDR
jgi:hypothetical protein